MRNKRPGYPIALALLFIYIQLLSCTTSDNITIENERLKVIISKNGAELQSIVDKKSGSEILWIGDSAYWKARSPVMFPVNVRFKDNRFTYKGKNFEMPKMGLAVLNNFSVLPENNSNAAVLRLSSNEDTKKRYPFDFNLTITYKLDGNKLINGFEVENTGADTMYFALGGHPGFNCPLDNAQSRANYQYVFPEKLDIKRTLISNSLVQDTCLPFLQNESSLQLDDERIPDGGMFLINPEFRKIGVGETGKPPFVTLDLEDFPNVNMWSPPGMPFACIEPMVSHHDLQSSSLDIQKKKHLINLAPEESQVYKFTIIVNGENKSKN